jgi:hypothetical protein
MNREFLWGNFFENVHLEYREDRRITLRRSLGDQIVRMGKSKIVKSLCLTKYHVGRYPLLN